MEWKKIVFVILFIIAIIVLWEIVISFNENPEYSLSLAFIEAIIIIIMKWLKKK